MQKVFNVGLLGVSPDNMNKGCEALLFSQLVLLRQLENESRKIRVYILYGQEPKKKVQYRIMGDLYEVAILPLRSFASTFSLLKNLRNWKDLREQKHLDYVLAIGYGDSFSDIYGKSRFNLINDPIRLFLKNGHKVVFMPQTIGPFNDDSLMKDAIQSLNRATIVFPRDKQSFQFVESNTCQKRVHELIDIAFFLPYSRIIFQNGKVNVGLSISGLLWRNGYTGNNEFGLKVNYERFIRDLIKYFLDQESVQLHLTPHVVNGSCMCEDDYSLSYSLQQQYGSDKILLSPFFKDPIMAKSYISGLDFFLGSRMHACIAAFSSGVPTIPISYSRKFTGLFSDTMGYPFILDPTLLGRDALMNQLDSFFQQKSQLKEKIEGILSTIVHDRKQYMLSELNQLFQ